MSYIKKDGRWQSTKVINGERWQHRIVWSEQHGKIPKGMVIDHINSNPLDNRIENLQCITQKQNCQRVPRSSGYKLKKSKSYKARPYQAYRTFNYKGYHLGMFATPCGAKMAYNTFFIGGNILSLT
mgnify:FL=1